MLLIVVSFQTGLQCLSPSGLGVMVSDTFACSLPPSVQSVCFRLPDKTSERKLLKKNLSSHF